MSDIEFLTKLQKDRIVNLADCDYEVDAEKEVALIEAVLHPQFAATDGYRNILNILSTLLWFFYTFLTFKNGYSVLGTILGVAEYAALGYSVYLFRITARDRKVLQSLLACITKIDTAMKSPALSPDRRQAAKALTYCGTSIRRYGPLLPVSLRARIIRRESRLGGSALMALVYPSMTGTKNELREVSEVLVRAAIKVANKEWPQVKNLKLANAAEYPTLRAPSEWRPSERLIAVAGVIITTASTIIPAIVS